MRIPLPHRAIVALLVGALLIPPAVMAQEATAPSPSKPDVPRSAFSHETAGRPASELAGESALRRFENVFFISLPFTALHSTLLITGIALAAQKGEFKLTLGYQIAGIGLAILGAGWIAVKDLGKNKERHLIQ